MPGINTTGKPKTSDYIVGRGRVYAARLDSGDLPQEWRDLGNAPAFKANVSATILEHTSSRQGQKYVDAQVVTQQKTEVSLDLDEINFENLALFFSGTEGSYSNTTATGGVTADATVGNLKVYKLGCWYDLYKATTGAPSSNVADSRIYDIGTLTVTSLDAMTTYTLGTDYDVDLKNGRIFIRSDGTMTANSTTPVKYRVNIAAKAGADTAPSEVVGLSKTSVNVALKFIMVNPYNADQEYEVTFWKVQLAADGDFNMISDEWTKLSFKGVAQSNVAASPNSPVVTCRVNTNAHS